MGQRIVRMTTDLFQEIMTEGWVIPNRSDESVRCVRGLPSGAQLVGVSNQFFFTTGDIALKFEHESWPEIPYGQVIPEIVIEYLREPISTVLIVDPPE